jgi:iron complex outermembrane receptor protein
MSRNYVTKLSLPFSALLTLGISGLASAQDTSPNDEQSTVLEEIVVTAQRREEILNRIGLAITAVAGEEIRAMQMADPADLFRRVPSLQLKTQFDKSNPQVFLRGVGVNDDTALTSGGVGFYSDEVYIGAPAGQLFPLFDLERVEVLRGPQGTLYGRNTTGGAINFVSRRPGDEFEANVRLGVGGYDQRALEAAVGGPLSSALKVRAAVIVNQRNGYIDNLFLGTRNATVDNWAARGLLTYDFSDRASLMVKLHGARNEAEPRQFRSQGLLDPEALAAGMFRPCATPGMAGTCSDALGYIDSPDPYSGRWDRVGVEDVDITGASVKWTSRFAAMELTSITAYSETKRVLLSDTDGSPNQLLHIDWRDANEQFTQEFRLQSASGDQLNWIAGVYYLDQKINIDQTNDVFRELRPAFGFDPSRFVVTVNSLIDQDLTSYSAFGQVEIELSNRLRLVAGLRYTDERRSMTRSDRLVEPEFSIPLVNLSDSVSFDNLSGKLAVERLDGSENLMYASLSSGFKSGGFNGAVALDPESVPPFDEETLVTFELGYKWKGFDQRVSLNTAAFYTDYDDLQVFTRVVDDGIPRELLTNAADAVIVGLEAELSAVLAHNLDVRLSLGLLDTELKDYQTAGGRNYSGNKLVGAPDVTLNGQVRKLFELGNDALVLQIDTHYQDDVFFETSNDPLLAQSSYWIWGGRIAYRRFGANWELALWGKNLSGEEYLTSAVGLGVFGYNLQSWSEPRTWGVEFSWQL